MITFSSGITDVPVTAWELLSPATLTGKPTVVMVPGGAHTASCYLATADGRPGWASDFLRAGYPVLLADWPGTGRSGYVVPESLTGQTVCDGLAQVIATVSQPVVLLVHSMSGAYGWRLIEQCGERISRVVAIAPAPPGNIQPHANVVHETADTIEVRGTISYTLSRRNPFTAHVAFVRDKLVGTGSTRFPLDTIERYTASLVPLPSQLIQERQNIAGSQLRVVDTARFAGKPILVVTGSDDVDHPRALDAAVAEWLNDCGAKAEFIYLPERGINGNGHMLMLEDNSRQIADLLIEWIGGQR